VTAASVSAGTDALRHCDRNDFTRTTDKWKRNRIVVTGS